MESLRAGPQTAVILLNVASVRVKRSGRWFPVMTFREVAEGFAAVYFLVQW
jgi:hypothetical protein